MRSGDVEVARGHVGGVELVASDGHGVHVGRGDHVTRLVGLGSRRHLSLRLIVQEFEVVRALVPLVELSVRAGANMLLRSRLRGLEARRSSPVAFGLRVLLRDEPLHPLDVSLVEEVGSRADVQRRFTGTRQISNTG